MKTTITFWNKPLKNCLLIGLMVLCYSQGFAQIFVDDVYPRRVTTGSQILIKKENMTFTSIECGTFFELEQKNVLPFPATGPSMGRILIITGTSVNDEVLVPLMINKKTVHTGSFPPTILNQVFITYVAPRNKSLVFNSTYLVNEIFTNWNFNGRGFWSSQDGIVEGLNGGAREGLASPDNYHELLGFRVGVWPGSVNTRIGEPTGVIYSTGVDDELLQEKLKEYLDFSDADLQDPTKYQPKIFKAYSSFGIEGDLVSHTDPGKDAFLLAADLIDNAVDEEEGDTDTDLSGLENIKGLTVFDAISDGRNGLELGTAVANFNKDIKVNFYSGNGSNVAVGDNTPDLLITQMGGASGYDIYYYTDPLGNVIGRPIRLYISTGGFRTRLAYWNVDTYAFLTGDFASATPDHRKFTSPRTQYKSIWMAAFQLEDFEITGSEVQNIESVTMNSDGSADMAFMAYNQSSFKIKAPIVKPLLTKYICKTDEGYSVSFELEIGENVGIDIGDGEISIPDTSDPLTFQWLRNNIPLTAPTVENPSILNIANVSDDDIGTYKVRIGNSKGNIIMRVDLLEGGYPHNWNGTSWELAPVYADAGFVVAPQDRRLIFSSHYPEVNEVNGVLEGCDCFIANETNVVIKDGQTLKLHGAVNVAPEVVAAEGVDPKDAGTLTLENNASLIQTKDVDVNVNSGKILVKRDALTKFKYDYVYWSSPVEEGNLSMIPGNTSHVYEWDTTADNIGTSFEGNWVKPSSGAMQIGRGYIKRFNNPGPINSQFLGKPSNGTIPVTVHRTESLEINSSPAVANAHLNLLGNPYPSAIFAKRFLTDNVNIEGWVQIWTHSKDVILTGEGEDDPFYGDFKYNYGDQYLTYNLTGTTPPDKKFDGFIASGQGFFVQVKNDSPQESTVNFTNSMRYDAEFPNGYINSDFYRSAEDPIQSKNEKELIWLSLVNEQLLSSTTLVGYVDGATFGKDRLYDVVSGSGEMKLFSVIEEADLLIQGRPAPFDDNDEVALGVEIVKNGIYKIAINQLKGELMENENQKFFLEDRYTNTIHDLKTAPYTFTATEGKCKDRFVLRYRDAQLSVEDQNMSNTFVYVNNEQLYVKASSSIEAVEVYDLTGKKLLDYKLDGHSDNFNTGFQFPKGAYITVIHLEGKVAVSKKIIN